MKKIISLFQRNYDGNKKVRDEIVPGAEWVIAGEGIATRKYDGTCCLIRDGQFFKRHEVKPGGIAPAGFEPANDVDENTGKQQGWLPVGTGPENKWHWEAFDRVPNRTDGTYELVGPKINGNPEKFERHELVRHGQFVIYESMYVRTFADIRDYLNLHDFEGIVWHHPDGRMVKIKKKDFA